MLKLKILILLLAVVVVGGVSGLLGSHIWNPSWNPFGLSSQEILEKALSKQFSLRTLRTEGNFEVEIQSVKEPDKTLKVSLSGFLKGDIENQKTEGSFDLKFGLKGMEASLTGEIKTIGNIVYLKATSLPLLPLFGEAFASLEGQWIKIDPKKLGELTGQKTQNLNEEEKEKLFQDLKNLLQGKKIFLIKKNLGKEKTEEVKTYHFIITFNKEELKKLIPEFFRVIEKYVSEEEKTTYQESLDKFLTDFPQRFDEIYQKIGGIDFEVWIGESDFYLIKIKAEKELKLEEFLEEVKKIEGEGVNLKIIFEAKFSEFNGKFEIEIPEDFKSIEELLSR
ncbi:MAG: hypothetical protein QMC93_00005 [Patescibacteria group bacterium]|nr:hypothetical protein [Patescibacteria group bacterium]